MKWKFFYGCHQIGDGLSGAVVDVLWVFCEGIRSFSKQGLMWTGGLVWFVATTIEY